MNRYYFLYRMIKEIVILPFKLIGAVALTAVMCVADTWYNIIDQD